jgi:threonine aldolase
MERPMIDLRSDTCSRPTDAMRRAMAHAEVGDDVYGDDPTVKALERAVAHLLGKDDAVYMPSGTMTNQVAVATHTRRGDTVLMDQSAHIYLMENGGAATLSGAFPRPLPGVRGVFTAADVEAVIGVTHPFFPTTMTAPPRLLCLENTHNFGGGAVWPLDAIVAVTDAGRRHGLATHLDGARLWNATAATGISEADYCAPFDSVSVCMSKALGAPVGSLLAGGADFIGRARRFKQAFGGGFRQAGIIAAGALHALNHHRPRLSETHELARRFAQGLAQIDGVEIDPAGVETNIVRFRLTGSSAGRFVDEAHRRGLWMLPSGSDAVRSVFYLDLTEADVDAALKIVSDTLRALPPEPAGQAGTERGAGC